MITDSARSRGPVSIVKTAAMDYQIKRLEANNVVKVITTRSTQILISTSKVSSMNREGQPMMICGELVSALASVLNVLRATYCKRWISKVHKILNKKRLASSIARH